LGKEILEMDCEPILVYVTAYQEYALQAFKVNALDYLLKPIDTKEFEKTIRRAIKMHKDRTCSIEKTNDTDKQKEEFKTTAASAKKEEIFKISAEKNGKILIIDPDEIVYAYVDDNYVYVKRYSDTIITKYALASLEEKLRKLHFFRVNRSYLVNLDKVKQIKPFFKGSCYLVMDDQEKSEISVSRRQTKNIKNIFDF